MSFENDFQMTFQLKNGISIFQILSQKFYFWNFWNFEILKINFLQDEKLFFIRIFFIVLVYSSAIPNIYLERP